MLRRPVRKRWIAAGAAGAVALAVGGFAARLASGPVEADWVAGAAEKGLVKQVPGGRARVQRAWLVWFDEAGSLGVRLENVALTDGKGRDVLKARRAEVGVAAGSLLGFKPALGRAAAQDFSLAVSVSRKGRYALGYDAAGAPERVGSLDGLLADLAGAPRHGRPLSWLRQVELERGRIDFRQVGGGAAWSGAVRTVDFEKTTEGLAGRVDLSIDPVGAEPPARLKIDARGTKGLAEGGLTATIGELRPARVFPSVGATAALSALDAPVRAAAVVDYALRFGVRRADVRVQAGPGTLRAGGAPQRFDGGDLTAAYAPAGRAIEVRSFRVAAERLNADLTGRLALRPEDKARGRAAALTFTLGGPSAIATLAADAPAQRLTDLVARGRFVPTEGRFEVEQATAVLEGARLKVSTVVERNRKGELGMVLKGAVQGVVGRDAVFAFWPRSLAYDTRAWLHGAVLDGQFENPTFVIDAPNGALSRPVLKNEAMDIRFRFHEAAVRFDEAFPAVERGSGEARVRGNRFDLTLASGRLGEAALSEGVIAIPRFKPGGAPATFKTRATGSLDGVLRVIDGPKLRLVSNAGLPPERTGGKADVRIEIVRPMLNAVPVEDYRIRYEGTVTDARLQNAALGWNLEQGAVRVEGDAKGLRVEGRGAVGPFRGTIVYRSDFDGADKVEADGAVLASAVGGLPGRTAPFKAEFTMNGGEGKGRVRSTLFEGRASWVDTAQAGRFDLDGVSFARALNAVQAPLTAALPARVPTRLQMRRSGASWRGELAADALSGSLAFTPGDRARLVYRADVTPVEAGRLGLAGLPLFALARPVTVDTVWGERDGEADVRVGPLAAEVLWNDRDGGAGERRVRARLSRADLAGLGVPQLIRPAGETPVEAAWRTGPAGTDLTLQVAGVPVRLRADPDGQSVATALVDSDALKRLGVDAPIGFDGTASVTARWRPADGGLAGAMDADLTGAELALPRDLWSKRSGKPARLSFAFAKGGNGVTTLDRISLVADGLEVAGAATVAADGRLAVADFARVKADGVYDGAVRLTQGPDGDRALTVRARWMDATRFMDRPSGGPERLADVRKAAAVEPIGLDLAVATLKLGRGAALQDVRAAGRWGGVADRRLEGSARTVGTAVLRLTVSPAAGVTAIRAETADAGAAAQALFGLTSLKGGKGVVTGKLVEGGADLNLDARDVRLVRAPTMAQILTLGSLDGLADTLNGEGVRFSRVVAPVKLRGSKVIVGEARATGSALGFTTQGVADLDAETLDFEGTLAPAYALNSMIGAVPVLGQVLVSREGEGVVGLGWSAKGSIDKPRVAVNPLSLVTPGVLRRIFETAPATERPAPKGR